MTLIMLRQARCPLFFIERGDQSTRQSLDGGSPEDPVL
jgi:hypothetical protein